MSTSQIDPTCHARIRAARQALEGNKKTKTTIALALLALDDVAAALRLGVGLGISRTRILQQRDEIAGATELRKADK